MKKYIFILLSQIAHFNYVYGENLPSKENTLYAMRIANNYFMNKWPDPGMKIIVDSVWPITQHKYQIGKSWESSLWTRSVYYEGLLAISKIDSQQKYLDYITKWGDSHQWQLNGNYSRHADNHCAAKTFIQMFEMYGNKECIKNTKLTIDSVMNMSGVNDWTWIDAIYMGMPVFARLGKVYNDHGLIAMSSSETKNYVLKNAGAFPWERDEVDKKIIEEVISGQGKIIDSESEAGGYPKYKPTYSKFDSNEWDMETLTRMK